MKRSLLAVCVFFVMLCSGCRAPEAGQSFICGEASDCAVAGDRLLTVSRGSVKCFTLDGETVFEKDIEQGKAYLCGSPDIAMACCLGGETLVFGSGEEIKTDGGIISADVSDGGFTAVCTESMGCKGAVTVYSPLPEPVYKWYGAENAPKAAAVSPAGKYLAILAGNRVHLFALDSEEEKGCFEPGCEAESIVWLGESVCVIGKNAVYVCSESGREKGAHGFGKAQTGLFAVLEDALAVEVFDTEGESIYIIDSKGNTEKILELSAKPLSLDCADGRLLVLTQNAVSVYNAAAQEIYSFKVSGISGAMLCKDGVLAVGGGSAQMFAQ